MLMLQNHMTKYFCKAKEHGVQWQLNSSCCLTCTPGRVAAQSNPHEERVWDEANRHGNTVVLGKFQATCVSEITVELPTFFP